MQNQPKITCLILVFQWRRGLKLSGESTVEKITLDGVRGLRVTLSATVHDVLYYMSPIYCQAIINSVLYFIFNFSVSLLLFYSFVNNNPFDHLKMLCLWFIYLDRDVIFILHTLQSVVHISYDNWIFSVEFTLEI